MEDKKHYYVMVDIQEIRDVSIPDSGIEFEIIASHSEIEEIQELFMKKNDNAKNAIGYLTKPFNEWGADDERCRYDNNMIMIYRKVFELGTKETKLKIKEMGIFT